MHFFSYDSVLSRFLHFTADIITLHILWLVCSLPLVTIGASTTALYCACMKRIQKDEGYVSRHFLRSFRQNLRQSTICWLLFVLGSFLIITNFRIARSAGGWTGHMIFISNAIILCPFILTFLYVFAVVAKFDNPVTSHIKYAFILSLKHFPCSVILLLIHGTFIFLSVSFPPFIGLLLCCGIGFLGYLSSNIFVYIFQRYIPSETEDTAYPAK